MRSRSTTRYPSYRSAVVTLQQRFTLVEAVASSGRWPDQAQDLFDLAERETADAIGLQNQLDGDRWDPAPSGAALQQSSVLAEDPSPSESDLPQRWSGALFALSSRNPDAARHFCSSTREMFDAMLVGEAPDFAVLTAIPDAETTIAGRPTQTRAYPLLPAATRTGPGRTTRVRRCLDRQRHEPLPGLQRRHAWIGRSLQPCRTRSPAGTSRGCGPLSSSGHQGLITGWMAGCPPTANGIVGDVVLGHSSKANPGPPREPSVRPGRTKSPLGRARGHVGAGFVRPGRAHLEHGDLNPAASRSTSSRVSRHARSGSSGSRTRSWFEP